MRSERDLINSVGSVIASRLGLPNNFGGLAKRYAFEGGQILADASGKKLVPTLNSDLSGWHILERADSISDKRSLGSSYRLSMKFVCFGKVELEGAEWCIANALKECATLEGFITDLPQVVANNFPSLTQRLQAVQPQLFAGEFSYKINYHPSFRSGIQTTIGTISAPIDSDMIHNSFHNSFHN